MNNTENNSSQSWLLRFVKGMFIGSGFIIPGVSGGALAAIFGLYERIIGFLANIRKNFVENNCARLISYLLLLKHREALFKFDFE